MKKRILNFFFFLGGGGGNMILFALPQYVTLCITNVVCLVTKNDNDRILKK